MAAKRSRKAAPKTVKSKKKTTKKVAKPAKASSKSIKLLVSYDPNHIGSAEKELAEVLTRIGEKANINKSEVEGLFKVAVSDGRKVAQRLRDLCTADPNLFQVTHHYVPVDHWCKSDITPMKTLIKGLAKDIGDSEKWRLSVKKRHWKKMDEMKLIETLADSIENEHVDLSKPDKIVRVDIIGKEAGISLLDPGDVFDAPETKNQA